MSMLFRKPARAALRVCAGVALGAWVCVIAGVYGYERAHLWANRNAATVDLGDGKFDPMYRYEVEGVVRPAVVKAGASNLAPDQEVIGIEVAGRARAYRLFALHDRARHVINDMIGEVPVTVTFCNMTACLRAYTDPRKHAPLDVSLAGLYVGKGMVLDVGGTRFFQDSGTRLGSGAGPAIIPLTRITPTRTTWGEWKRAHPETDLYEGYL